MPVRVVESCSCPEGDGGQVCILSEEPLADGDEPIVINVNADHAVLKAELADDPTLLAFCERLRKMGCKSLGVVQVVRVSRWHIRVVTSKPTYVVRVSRWLNRIVNTDASFSEVIAGCSQ